MKNADGSYRIMPGFSSLIGRMSGHPPVDVSKVNQPVDATGEGVAEVDDDASSNASKAVASSGCPVKHDGGSSSRSFNIFRRGGSGPGSANINDKSSTPNNNDVSACPVKQSTSNSTQQQYDVYSRPLPIDPTNNMPTTNPVTLARNSLPTPSQSTALPTERVSSTIPKGGTDGETWTYPSPQMFYNALARKGKLGDTKEEDMESVVALHNCMNEGTWGKILEWEEVLNDNGTAQQQPQPKLSRFLGRPTDLSPKAFFKHYFLSHPLPFDRHDWTILRPNGEEVRYVIDYYHDDAAANEEDGSGLPHMHGGIGEGGQVKSLMVDVRPAVDGIGGLREVYGRMVTMPLARRGCESILDCVLGGGEGKGDKSKFEPLPLYPNESLKSSLGESEKVWENIQRDAANKKGVGPKDGGAGDACASDKLQEDAAAAAATTTTETNAISKADASKIAESFSQILSKCQESKAALQHCSSEDECSKAFMGMTVCAGQFMCPLQHKSLMASLEDAANASNEEMAEAKINTAFDVLGECVTNYDKRAIGAKKQYPDVFEKVFKK
jgi:cytochrome c heme-lyase